MEAVTVCVPIFSDEEVDYLSNLPHFVAYVVAHRNDTEGIALRAQNELSAYRLKEQAEPAADPDKN